MPRSSAATTLAQTILLLQLLREGERRRADLAIALGVTLRTVDRMLGAIGETVEVTRRRDGRDTYLSVSRAAMRQLFP